MGALGLPALAATITVNTTVDEFNSDGDCSLREAIHAANTDTAVDACTTGAGADTIVLAAGATYTLSLDADTGGHETDSGADNDDLDIVAGSVTIANNTGADAGGIYNDGGTVNIKNSIVGNNTGGGAPNCDGDPLTPTGVNFDTDGSCTGFTNTSALNLGPLAVNEPGTTATHALLAGSVAINAVTDLTTPIPNPVTQDQRGVFRPQFRISFFQCAMSRQLGESFFSSLTIFS